MNKWTSLLFFGTILLYITMGSNQVAFSQSIMSVTVVDSRSGLGIPGVNVRLSQGKVVKETDKNGFVLLKLEKDLKNDTIIFTHVSYNTFKMPAAKLSKETTVPLAPKSQVLAQVDIFGKPSQTITFNKIGQMIPYPPMSGQVAQMIKCNESGGVLKSIIIARSLPRNNVNPQTKFKLYIYDLNNETGGPGESLLGDGIVVNNEKDEYIQIDFSNNPVSIPQKVFFIGIEWLIIPYNEYATVQISQVPETLDSSNNIIPLKAYNGTKERRLGVINYKAQIIKEGVKIVGKANSGKPSLDRRGKQIYRQVISISCFYQPTLKAIPGIEPGYIWILKAKDKTSEEWYPKNHFFGEKLAISATVTF